MKKRTEITKEMMETLREMRASGSTAKEVAEKLGVAEQTAHKHMSKLPKPKNKERKQIFPRKSITAEQEAEMERLYKQGFSVRNIALKTGASPASVALRTKSMHKDAFGTMKKSKADKPTQRDIRFQKDASIVTPPGLVVKQFKTTMPAYAKLCASTSGGTYDGKELKYRG